MHLFPPNLPGLIGLAILRELMVYLDYLVPLRNNPLWHRLRLHHLPVLETTLVQLPVDLLVGKTGAQRLPPMGISPLPDPLARRTGSSTASPLPEMNLTPLPAIKPK